jgi:AcrR family transcriptional regulator
MSDYHHGNLPRALLDAALIVLAEQGVAALSLREVARRAGVSHGAPAHHFSDKTGLLTALAAEGFEKFRAALEAGRDQAADHPLSRFAATGKAYVRFAIEHPQHFELMFRHELIDVANPALMEAGRAAYEVLLNAVIAAQQEGLASNVAADVVATGAWAFGHGMATLWLGGNLKGRDWERDMEQLLPILFTGSGR